MTALTAVDPGPLPPSYGEMEQAILRFSAEWFGIADPTLTPGDLVLLSLAERLQQTRPVASVEAPSGAVGVET